MTGILIERNGSIATLWLNRPDRHNAFDDRLIAELIATLKVLAEDPQVRVLLLAGKGKSFSAGADLNWMRRMAGYSLEENEADAQGLAELMHRLDSLPKPTIALVQGAAMAGGVGLVAACDIAIAAEDAVFGLSEARIGLTPATISPYVIAAMGRRAARRYFLTAERFDARRALALAAAKDLIAAVAGRPIDADLRADTARRIARQRAGAEGREGVAAFLEKRKPSWQGR
jgi:methylglutaconyl-CoA hydratase